MRLRLLVVALCVVLAVSFGLFAQQDPPFRGRYEDVRMIEQRKQNTTKFVFARLIYNGRIEGYYKNWYTDYPKGDRQLLMGIRRLTNLEVDEKGVALPLTDPDLPQYPFLYSSEVGQLVFTDKDAAIMREYLSRGGFWVVDDFWGSFEMANFETQLRKVLPNAEIKDIPRDHPIFHVFYDVNQIIQVPSLAYTLNGGITFEQDGFVGECKGVWDQNGRLAIVINHNTDLGDAYEWADEPRYPNYFSSFAYRMAINFILYALSH